MKPDHLTFEEMADSFLQYHTDFLGCLAWLMCRKARQSSRPATLPLNLNKRCLQNDLFMQEPGPESRSKDHAWGCKVINQQKRC